MTKAVDLVFLAGIFGALSASIGASQSSDDPTLSSILANRCSRLGATVRPRALAGDAAALATLGALYDRGCGVTQDMPHARQYFRKAVDAGSTAPAAVGYLALYAKDGADQDRGVRILKAAALDGDVLSARELGQYLANRDRSNADEVDSFRFERIASNGGDMKGRAALAGRYAFGDVTRSNVPLAKQYFADAMAANESFG